MQTRRGLLISGLALSGLAAASRAGAGLLVATPQQTAGPFYPTKLPLDADNDLVRVKGRPSQAMGEVIHVFGRILDPDGRPLEGARVEIWQCDATGRYHHPRDRGGRADPNFQGFGAMEPAADGAFRFRTIKPVPYPGRAPHIHFAVRAPGTARFTTQMYVKGHPLNARDGILNSVRDPQARANLIVDLQPAPELETGSLAGNFDIVLGQHG